MLGEIVLDMALDGTRRCLVRRKCLLKVLPFSESWLYGTHLEAIKLSGRPTDTMTEMEIS